MSEVASNSAVAVAEPVTGQAATVPAQTPETRGTPANGQANTQAQSAPAEDRFTSVDPETLPPELKAVYKSLQADYTKKTQGAAELRKKAEGYDKITSRPDFKDYWNGLNKTQKQDFKDQKQQAEVQLGKKITDEEFQKAFESKESFIQLLERVADEKYAGSRKEIEDLKAYKETNEASFLVDSFKTELGEDKKPLHPDFDALEEDGLISGFMKVNAVGVKNPQEFVNTLKAAYEWGSNLKNKYYEMGKSEALKVIQNKVQTSTQPPTNAAKGAYTGPDPKSLTAKEAFDLAKRGIRVPRD